MRHKLGNFIYAVGTLRALDKRKSERGIDPDACRCRKFCLVKIGSDQLLTASFVFYDKAYAIVGGVIIIRTQNSRQLKRCPAENIIYLAYANRIFKKLGICKCECDNKEAFTVFTPLLEHHFKCVTVQRAAYIHIVVFVRVLDRQKNKQLHKRNAHRFNKPCGIEHLHYSDYYPS